MTTVAELERAIEKLSAKEFEMLAAWVEQRSRALRPRSSSEPVAPEKTLTRDHNAFLNSYAPEDEGLYDDAAAG